MAAKHFGSAHKSLATAFCFFPAVQASRQRAGTSETTPFCFRGTGVEPSPCPRLLMFPCGGQTFPQCPQAAQATAFCLFLAVQASRQRAQTTLAKPTASLSAAFGASRAMAFCFLRRSGVPFASLRNNPKPLPGLSRSFGASLLEASRASEATAFCSKATPFTVEAIRATASPSF